MAIHPTPPYREVPYEKQTAKFSAGNRLQSIGWSFKGLVWFASHTHAFWIQAVLTAAIMGYASTLPGMTPTDWALLVLGAGLIFVTECLNTAIEIVVDRISTEFHDLSGLAKDVAAGAVMLAVTVALVIAAIVVLPKLG